MVANSLTSDEVNYLVYRYLLESGFTHASFAFAQEAAVHTRDYLHHHLALPSAYPSLRRPDDIRGARVPPGQLVAFLQKGLLYTEVEAHTREDGSARRCSAPFSLCLTHECVDDDEDQQNITTTNANEDTADEPEKKKQKRDRKDKKKDDREKKLKSQQQIDEDEAQLATATDVTIYKPTGDSIGAVYCVAWNPRFMLLAAGYSINSSSIPL
ncbi:UNVERIFIED_CONTAM: hypothetical protein HDU68_004747 [Siphonaria sp. JEL0065]|nr:hypothetical protein HDU68_004747 [Siphonaria sp. JEL0065]